MAHAQLPLVRRRFGETMRRDRWWVQPAIVVVLLSSFLIYSTWAAFQGTHYTYGPYLSPFYSPELFGDSPHAWFGPKPGWWPGWLPFSPALLILPFPGIFRVTCYYYRGAYYKAFWADPPACTVGEPRTRYLGESAFPLIVQNIHRYFLYLGFVLLAFLAHDVWKATHAALVDRIANDQRFSTLSRLWSTAMGGAPDLLEEMLDQVTEENRHGLIDWGPAVGKEAW